MKKNLYLLAALLFTAMVLSLGCGECTGDTVPEESLVLRTYDVPEAYQDQVRQTLGSILRSRSDEPIGRVSSLPGGKLAVLAPAGVQRGIEGLVGNLDRAEGLADASAPVSLNYWFLAGRPSSSPAEGPYSIHGGKKLPGVEPALMRIADVDGPTEFRLLEKITLVSTHSQRAMTRGRFARVTHRAGVAGENIIAEISINYTGTNNTMLDTNVTLESGQILVLAQAGFPSAREVGKAFPGVEGNDRINLYVILTAGE